MKPRTLSEMAAQAQEAARKPAEEPHGSSWRSAPPPAAHLSTVHCTDHLRNILCAHCKNLIARACTCSGPVRWCFCLFDGGTLSKPRFRFVDGHWRRTDHPQIRANVPPGLRGSMEDKHRPTCPFPFDVCNCGIVRPSDEEHLHRLADDGGSIHD